VGSQSNETRSTFDSTTGGVMTEEAGAITGELEAETRSVEGSVEIKVRYAGADEWYTVEGSPLESREAKDTDALHERVVEHLQRPGPTANGNEEPVSLKDFS